MTLKKDLACLLVLGIQTSANATNCSGCCSNLRILHGTWRSDFSGPKILRLLLASINNLDWLLQKRHLAIFDPSKVHWAYVCCLAPISVANERGLHEKGYNHLPAPVAFHIPLSLFSKCICSLRCKPSEFIREPLETQASFVPSTLWLFTVALLSELCWTTFA